MSHSHLNALETVGHDINCADSEFVTVATITVVLKSTYTEHGRESRWDKEQPSHLVAWLKKMFKGLVTQLTNESFVCQTFGWKHISMAQIHQELGMADFYLADLQATLKPVEYWPTTSTSQRKRMRWQAQIKVASEARFLNSKRGGWPSKIRQFSC